MLKYWIKILSSDRNSLLYKAYNILRFDTEHNIGNQNANWAYHIKSILEECGLLYIWHNQENIMINFHTIKQRILDIYYQNWYSEINNSRRLETYCLFKHSFSFEHYLDYINEPKFRIALTRFRISSHDLAIENGRYLNIARENRLCNNCETRQIENEFHHLLTCSKFSDLRSKYIKRYYYTWPTIQKLSNLLSLKSTMMIKNVSKYLYYAKLRVNNPED